MIYLSKTISFLVKKKSIYFSFELGVLYVYMYSALFLEEINMHAVLKKIGNDYPALLIKVE